MKPLSADWPPLGRAATAALFAACLAIVLMTVVRGLSSNFAIRLVQLLACSAAAAVFFSIVIGWITGRMSNYQAPADEDEFDRLLERSERLAAEPLVEDPDDGDFSALDPYDPHDFEALVREALDELPDLLLRSLSHVAVVISDEGHRYGAYGLYQGDTIARDGTGDRVVIFRDTLLHDFGDDPDELRDQVTRTVRHELAHHLGADELGVRDLGL